MLRRILKLLLMGFTWNLRRHGRTYQIFVCQATHRHSSKLQSSIAVLGNCLKAVFGSKTALCSKLPFSTAR